MNNKISSPFLPMFGYSLILLLMLIACEKSSNTPEEIGSFFIDGISIENYPRVDGSTSAEPLQALIACKLLGIDYSWTYQSFWYKYTYRLMPSCDIKPDVGKYITEGIYHTGTHHSFVNLINKNVDLIITARTASSDELHLADSVGVGLTVAPIALDAFVFVNHVRNPVNTITTQQIRDIYTGNIKGWNEIGGAYTKINAYQRNQNSGSQELMESLVMNGLEMIELPNMIVYGMMGLINRVEFDRQGLGYSVNYYTQYMVRSDSIKLLAIDGVNPDFSTIKSKLYNYTTNVYAVIRKNLDQESNAYKIFQLLQTDAGQEVIKESGYIPYY